MKNVYNLYSDESCHCLNDGAENMILGTLWCKREDAKFISSKIKDLKRQFNIPTYQEIKWTKLSPSKINLYIEIINLFFSIESLYLRCIVANKSNLEHEQYHQTHTDWYYKMYWISYKWITQMNSNDTCYYWFMDPKDHNVCTDTRILEQISNHTKGSLTLIEPLDSSQNNLMQMVDILIGCINCLNNKLNISLAKKNVSTHFFNKSGITLQKNSIYTEKKVNILYWRGNI